jgi:hypothetical protein
VDSKLPGNTKCTADVRGTIDGRHPAHQPPSELLFQTNHQIQRQWPLAESLRQLNLHFQPRHSVRILCWHNSTTLIPTPNFLLFRNRILKMTGFCFAESCRQDKIKTIRSWFKQQRSFFGVSPSDSLSLIVQQVSTGPAFPTPEDLFVQLRHLEKLALTALPGDFNESAHATTRRHYFPCSFAYSSSTT